MAQISRKDLENLTSDQIREFFMTEDISKYKHSKIKEYIENGRDTYTMGGRVNRVEKILTGIIIQRFIKGTL